MTRRFNLASVLLICVLGIACYFNSVTNPFLWNDIPLILENESIRPWSNFASIFTQNVGSGIDQPTFYRPLQMLSYMVDYAIGGPEPWIYHVTNILIHVGVALAFFWMVLTVFDKAFAALFAALLYVVHPIHTQVVAYPSARTDLLTGLFMILSFIYYVKYLNDQKSRQLIMSLVTFACALLSKEYALILPVLFLVYHNAFWKALNFKAWVSSLFLATLYACLRITGVLGDPLFSHTASTTLYERLPGAFVAITSYLKLLLVPFPLPMGYGMKYFTFNHVSALIGVIFILGVIFCAVFHNRKDAMFSFGVVWFAAALLPVLNLIPAPAYMSLHWMYVPSIGFFILVGMALRNSFSSRYFKSAAVLIVSGLIALSGFLTFHQNETRKDPVEFYKRIIAFNPLLKAPYIALSDHYLRQGLLDQAIQQSALALRVIPSFPQAHNNLANALIRRNDVDEAIEHFEQALILDPNYFEAHNNLANALSRKGDFENAEHHYRRAIQINPHYVNAYINFGNFYAKQMNLKEALRQYKIALAIDPENVAALNSSAVIYAEMGEIEKAYQILLRALELDPNNDGVRANLYRVQGLRKDGKLPVL